MTMKPCRMHLVMLGLGFFLGLLAAPLYSGIYEMASLVEDTSNRLTTMTTTTTGSLDSQNTVDVNGEATTTTGHTTNSSSVDVVPLDLEGATAGDRTLNGLTVDLTFRLGMDATRLPPVQTNATFDGVMQAFHGENIWKDPQLVPTLQHFGVQQGDLSAGSTIRSWERLRDAFRTKKPRVIAELGVFRGASSIRMAKILDELANEVPELKDSFIVSVDTWLLDLQFVWTAEKKEEDSKYFMGTKVAGRELMYWVFLANVIRKQATHRIVPLPSSTLNGIQAFIAHGLRIDVCYLDASHANPDVFLDLVGVWSIINPGGVVICDDYGIKAVHTAVDSFVASRTNEIEQHGVFASQYWIYKK